jgi:hypothetical protein
MPKVRWVGVEGGAGAHVRFGPDADMLVGEPLSATPVVATDDGSSRAVTLSCVGRCGGSEGS